MPELLDSEVNGRPCRAAFFRRGAEGERVMVEPDDPAAELVVVRFTDEEGGSVIADILPEGEGDES